MAYSLCISLACEFSYPLLQFIIPVISLHQCSVCRQQIHISLGKTITMYKRHLKGEEPISRPHTYCTLQSSFPPFPPLHPRLLNRSSSIGSASQFPPATSAIRLQSPALRCWIGVVWCERATSLTPITY